MEVTLPPIAELNLWILPTINTTVFFVFATLFMKYARQAGEAIQNGKASAGDGLIVGCVGAAIISIAFLVITLAMSWNLFAKSLGLPGY